MVVCDDLLHGTAFAGKTVTHDHGEGDERLKGCKGFPLKGGEKGKLGFFDEKKKRKTTENIFERRLEDVEEG